MKKSYLLAAVLFSIIFLTVGCGLSGGPIKFKGAGYLYDNEQMKEMVAQIKKESGGEKLVGSIIFNVNNFSVKGVKVDGGADFWTLDPKDSTKTVRHLFSSPDEWKTMPDVLHPSNPIWDMDTTQLERIPELIKDAREKLNSQKEVTGETRMHKIIVDPDGIKITYKGEKRGAEYIVKGKEAKGTLQIKK